MATRKQIAAARRNIKKAQAALRHKHGRKRGRSRKGRRHARRGCSPKILRMARHGKRSKLKTAILRACGC